LNTNTGLVGATRFGHTLLAVSTSVGSRIVIAVTGLRGTRNTLARVAGIHGVVGGTASGLSDEGVTYLTRAIDKFRTRITEDEIRAVATLTLIDCEFGGIVTTEEGRELPNVGATSFSTRGHSTSSRGRVRKLKFIICFIIGVVGTFLTSTSCAGHTSTTIGRRVRNGGVVITAHITRNTRLARIGGRRVLPRTRLLDTLNTLARVGRIVSEAKITGSVGRVTDDARLAGVGGVNPRTQGTVRGAASTGLARIAARKREVLSTSRGNTRHTVATRI